MKKSISVVIVIFLFFITLFGNYDKIENRAYASQTKSVTVTKPAVNKTMKWVSSKSYSFDANSWMGTFPETINYNENGYSGTLKGKTIVLTPANKQTNRSVTLSDSWTDSTYRVRTSDVPEPSTMKKSYTDTATGTTITKNLPKSGGLVSTGSKTVKVYSASYGRAANYDKVAHTKLGYMSPNKTNYWSGTLKFSASKPRPPSDYYGPDGGEFGTTGWTLVDYAWDECCVRDAKDSAWYYKTKSDGYMWVTDAGLKQRYRKGVYLNYSKNVTGKKYKQNYKGTYALPDTATKWNVKVIYEGQIYGTNLTATSIDVVNTNNSAVSHLIKGQKYRAKITYKNTGETNVNSYYVKLLDNKVVLSDDYMSGTLKPNASNTITKDFIATQSGQLNTFEAFIDSRNNLSETNENDNKVSTKKYVNAIPTIAVSSDPNPAYEGDNVTICLKPNDEDGDLLTVVLSEKYSSNNWNEVLNKSSVKPGSCVNYKIPDIPTGKRDYKVTVSDSYDSSSTSFSLTPIPLMIKGHVTHTPQWEKIHQKFNDLPMQFFSGEQFNLAADVTDYPTTYMKVDFKGYVVNGSLYKKTLNLLQQSPILFKGELYEPAFLQTETSLAMDKHPVFLFTVRYQNGVIKTDTVTIDIIGSAYGAFNYHRLY